VKGNWRAYFELLRLPAVFTAIADVMMGYLVAHGDLRPLSHSALLVASSALLYLAGMVLNDYYDADADALERPERPVPSGRISPHAAARLGWGLLWAGVAVAGLAALVAKSPAPFFFATMLGYFIYLYDRLHEHLILAPLLMGFCRFLNVLLGMSLLAASSEMPTPVPWTSTHFAIAAGIGVYIAGVTIFARTEATSSSRRGLAAGIVVMAMGIAFLAFGASHVGNQSHYRWIVWLVIGAYAVIRHSLALVAADSRTVQKSVRHALRMLIFLDFVVAFEAAPHSSGCMLILLLYVPMLALEYWFSTT
jgi:4-hydroxybenzoate polyprenyltransferase